MVVPRARGAELGRARAFGRERGRDLARACSLSTLFRDASSACAPAQRTGAAVAYRRKRRHLRVRIFTERTHAWHVAVCYDRTAEERSLPRGRELCSTRTCTAALESADEFLRRPSTRCAAFFVWGTTSQRASSSCVGCRRSVSGQTAPANALHCAPRTGTYGAQGVHDEACLREHRALAVSVFRGTCHVGPAVSTLSCRFARPF